MGGLIQSILIGAIDVLEILQMLTENNERFRSVVNGVIGDTLEEEKSPLAIPMELVGEPRGKKLCILVHGLFDTVHTWQFPDKRRQDYGSLLKKDLGYTPLYLTYNTGLHISTNGRSLAGLLSRAYKRNPDRVQEIIFIGHSMGGAGGSKRLPLWPKNARPLGQTHQKNILFRYAPLGFGLGKARTFDHRHPQNTA